MQALKQRTRPGMPEFAGKSDGETIGMEAVEWLEDFGCDLAGNARTEFEPFEGVWCLNDSGDCICADEFEAAWAPYPGWFQAAWVLIDNGQYTRRDVAEMTLSQAWEAYQDPDYDPQFAFYTEADEEGNV